MGRFKMRGGFIQGYTWIIIIVVIVAIVAIGLGLGLGLKKPPPSAEPQTPSSNFVKSSTDIVLPVSVTLKNPQVIKQPTPPGHDTFPAELLLDAVASNPDAYENSTINYNAQYSVTENRDSALGGSNLFTAPPGNLSIDVTSTDVIRILSVQITVWIEYKGVIGPKAYYNYDPIQGLKRI